MGNVIFLQTIGPIRFMLIFIDNNYCDFRVLYLILFIIHRCKVPILYSTCFAQSAVRVLNFTVKCVYSLYTSVSALIEVH